MATGKNNRLAIDTLGLGANAHHAAATASNGQTKTHADCGKNSEYKKPLPDSNHALVTTYHAAGMATAKAASRANRASIDVELIDRVVSGGWPYRIADF